MARFVIRNYGQTQQVPYQNTQIIIARDGAIETDDEDIAATMKAQKDILVTDHGAQATSTPPEEPKQKKKKKRQVTIGNVEAVHAEKFPDEDEKEETPQEDESIEIDEIAYEEMTVVELKVLAKDRQIPTSGLLKAELIQALKDYDAEE